MEGHETILHIIEMGNIGVQSRSKNGKCSIQKVPHFFGEGEEKAYVPQIVSIGPFHNSNNSLQAMNDMKSEYVADVISWTQNNGRDSHKILDRYLMAVKSVEAEARACYSEPIHLNSNEFVKMMVIDGCFIIGLLCKAAGLMLVDCDDPIFNMAWLWSKLQKDLLMLENQIPFLVLQCLFNEMEAPVGDDLPSLIHLAFDFFQEVLKNETATKEYPKIRPKHLLHLIHSSLLPLMPKEDNQSERYRKRNNHIKRIHSVTALMEAGIKFKKAKSVDSFFNVKFNNCTMEIPTFVIHEATLSLFLNLIAFEQCYNNCTKHFTAYTALMSSLINSAKDVRILRKSGIVQDLLGNQDGDVARLFKKLGKYAAIPNESYLTNLFLAVSSHHSTKWDACKASLKRYYFNSRWAIIPFAAGFILLVLTIIQTIFTALSYFHQP